METVKIKFDEKEFEVEAGITILTAAKRNNITIPTLCYLKHLNYAGACRVCMVEIKGRNALAAACVTPVYDGMEILINSARAIDARRTAVELLLSNHPNNCSTCIKNNNCELEALASAMGVRNLKYTGAKSTPHYDDFSDGIVRDTSKCVLCGRCVAVCEKVQGLGVLQFQDRGFNTSVGPLNQVSMKNVNCMQCGQCVNVCPVGALTEKEDIHRVVAALNDPEMKVIVQTAPAVRASLGEEFGNPIGTRVTGKMVAALKKLGFYRVYDTNFAADLTIMEEGTEFLNRLKENKNLPLITSCSPGWIRYAEREYPEILPNISTCKSPHMMLGAMIKSYFAKINNIDPSKIFNVSVMPCVAKKSEINRPEMTNDGLKNVDAVLTTRELGRLIKMYGIDFNDLPDEKFDQDVFGEYTGAGVIFGATGGVMEAALRTVADLLTGYDLPKFEYRQVRGTQDVKEAELEIHGSTIKVAVAHSMTAAKPLLEQIKNGESPYHFIEIMGCPGGCVNGGGQSIVNSTIRNATFPRIDWISLRAKALYDEDTSLAKRKSHENQQVKDLYKNFLGEPGSHIAHEYLHCEQSAKPRYNFK